MKLGELDWRCGNCRAIEWCGPPWCDLCLCHSEILENLDDMEYCKMAEAICDRPEFAHGRNRKIYDEICKKMKGAKDENQKFVYK